MHAAFISLSIAVMPVFGRGFVPLVFWGDDPFKGPRLWPLETIIDAEKHALPTAQEARARAMLEMDLLGRSFGQGLGEA